MNRKKLLLRLIGLSGDISELEEQLSKFSWDLDEELVVLTKEEMIMTLNKYISGEISLSTLEKWAEALEVRDDVGYEKEVHEMVFVLANSYSTGVVSVPRAIEIIKSLTQY